MLYASMLDCQVLDGMFATDLGSLYTLSGILVIAASLLFVLRRRAGAAVLLIVAVSGGSAIAWDRWSQRSGDQVHLTALLTPAAPTAGELVTLGTHLPLLVVGLILLGVFVGPTRGS